MRGMGLWIFIAIGVFVYGGEDGVKVETLIVGSCAKQDMPQPFWSAINAEKPDVFLFIGDNIYANGLRYRKLKKQYAKLGRQPGFRNLRKQTELMATWDDNDYGEGDGGAGYANKHFSKKAFMKFFKPPKSARSWRGPGIYESRIFGQEGQRVQIIMLDTRFFRSDLNALPRDEWGSHGRYLPDHSPVKTMLGSGQWLWLEKQLQLPADLRIIATSIQAIPNDHGWEKWGNLPLERKRLFQLIKKTGAQGVVLVSGDRHMGEISKLPAQDPDGVGYPLYEMTSSGLNTKMAPKKAEKNVYRHGNRHVENHYGVIKIAWEKDPWLSLHLKATSGESLEEPVRIRLSELK